MEKELGYKVTYTKLAEDYIREKDDFVTREELAKVIPHKQISSVLYSLLKYNIIYREFNKGEGKEYFYPCDKSLDTRVRHHVARRVSRPKPKKAKVEVTTSKAVQKQDEHNVITVISRIESLENKLAGVQRFVDAFLYAYNTIPERKVKQ